MIRAVLLVTTIMLFIGCSEPEPGAGATASLSAPTLVVLNEHRDDPAMQPERRLGAGKTGDAQAPGSVGRHERDELYVDPDTNAVFVPGMGWQSAEAFMDIYLNRPQLLPDEFDHEAVQALKERLASQQR